VDFIVSDSHRGLKKNVARIFRAHRGKAAKAIFCAMHLDHQASTPTIGIWDEVFFGAESRKAGQVPPTGRVSRWQL